MPVVPTVAMTAHASCGSRRSGRSRNSSSAGTFRSSRSRRRAALSATECACSEHTSTRRSGWRERATIVAASTPVDAVSSMCPRNSSGSPTSCRSQSTVSSSSSWSAGEVRQRIPTWFRPAMRSSASTPGSEPVVAKYAKKRGLCQCVVPGRRIESRSATTFENGSGSSGAAAGRAARIAPGSTCERTGKSRTRSRYDATQSSASAPSSRKLLLTSGAWRSRATSAC